LRADHGGRQAAAEQPRQQRVEKAFLGRRHKNQSCVDGYRRGSKISRSRRQLKLRRGGALSFDTEDC
jgi:hypothetical protein